MVPGLDWFGLVRSVGSVGFACGFLMPSLWVGMGWPGLVKDLVAMRFESLLVVTCMLASGGIPGSLIRLPGVFSGRF